MLFEPTAPCEEGEEKEGHQVDLGGSGVLLYEAFDEPYRGDFVNNCSVVL